MRNRKASLRAGIAFTVVLGSLAGTIALQPPAKAATVTDPHLSVIGTPPAPITNCPGESHPLKLTAASLDAAGGAVYDFLDGQGNIIETSVPPTGWSPAAASAAELVRYDIPERPTLSSALADWTSQFADFKPLAVMNSPCVSDASRATPSSSNWGGELNTGGAYYQAVQGQFVVGGAANQSCGNSATVTQWVGIGGYNTGGLIQAGVDGRGANGRTQSWYEYLTSGTGSVNQIYYGPGFAVGDRAYIHVDWEASKSWAHFIIQNVTNGATAATVTKPLGSGFYDGSTAEGITERLTVNGGLTPLADHYQENFDSYQVQDTGGTWHNGNAVASYPLTDAGKENIGGWTSQTSFYSNWKSC